jgi:predicted ribonuclease YlaK
VYISTSGWIHSVNRRSSLLDIYVVDTDALIKDRDLIDKIHYGEIIIHTIVLEELDNIAKQSSSQGETARRIGDRLCSYQSRGNFVNGIKVGDKIIRFDNRKPNTEKYLSFGLDQDKNDNLLLCVAKELKETTGRRVVFVTGDKFLLLKASMDVEICKASAADGGRKGRKPGNKNYHNKRSHKNNKSKMYRS